MDESELAACVRRELDKYFARLAGKPASRIYPVVIHCAKKPVIEVVLDRAAGNLSCAAGVLSINHNTLRDVAVRHQVSAA